MRYWQHLKRFLNRKSRRRGSTVAEYGLLMAILLLAGIAAQVTPLENAIRDWFVAGLGASNNNGNLIAQPMGSANP